MKKPELYYMHRTYGERERVQLNMEKIAIWNSLYYRSKGRRRKYVVRETTPVDKLFRKRKYTRWQLEYDLKKPWHVSATYPFDFATFEEAVAYAFGPQSRDEVAHNAWLFDPNRKK